MWRSFAIVLVLTGCGSSKPPATPTTTTTTSDAPTTTPAGDTVSPRTPTTGTTTKPVTASGNRCDSSPIGELSIDGLLDDWRDHRIVTAVGNAADGAVELRCAWDGTGLAFVADIKDDRVIRVKGGQEDHVSISIAAASKPIAIDIYPGTSMGKPKHVKPAKVSTGDSLQPKGFSIEVAIPASAIPEMSAAVPSLKFHLVFHDSDAATGGDTTPIEITMPIELSDRKDLLDDFLTTVRLRKTDIKVDTLVELDPDRKGKERIVAGGTVIGVLTDQFAFVTLPAASPADVRKIELLPLGPKGVQIVSAIVRQTGNGGSRDLLMLWTVWSGQLQPLVNIEIRKEFGPNLLETTWKLAKGKKGPELIVEPKPAVGFTPENYNEVPAGDADPILLPWDVAKAGIAYSMAGKEIARRDLPVPKKKKK